MATKLLSIDTPIIPLSEVRRFIMDCMLAKGAPKPNAEALADLLTEADYRGHYSHGMNRLDMYVNDIEGGLCDCAVMPKIVKESPATALVDGRNGLGAVVGRFCMDVAIQKAKSVGIGWVVARSSNHYGICGMYTMQAMKEGLIGMSMTNTSPLMAPTRAKNAALGTNPISVGAPGNSITDGVVLDMATTAVALGKIEMQKRKHEPLPLGWALDNCGVMTTDAEAAYEARRLLPLGGIEETAGYKGYGLAMMVEIFCGLLAGSQYGPNIRLWGDNSMAANLGQCFVAINPEFFATGFKGRITDLVKYVRNMEPAEKSMPVLVPGDPERMHMKAVDEAGGLRYVPDQLETCAKLAKKLKVIPLKGKPKRK